MGLELRQNLKLTQQLVMTPQLQQAIKLLQLSRFELLEAVQQELLENPMLEEAPRELSEEVEAQAPPAEQRADVSFDDAELMRNADWENYLGDFSSTTKQVQFKETEALEEMMSYEARLSGKPSLEGHLLWQLCLSNITEEEEAIGEAIIGNLDSLGYLTTSAEEIASETLSPLALVQSVLYRLQRFDPVGVAARSPKECLLIQLEVLGQDDPILISLVDEHLEDIEKRRYKPLLRKFKIQMEDLKAYLDIIQTLDPMPGASYGSDNTVFVSPDVFVYEYEGDFVIVMNDDGLPKLQLSPYYMEDTNLAVKGPDREYLHDKMRSAMWLMKSLHQRQRTLYKVVESIVRFQRAFFEHGVTKLKPLILKDVADDIEMHESTVSRITTSKYVATPHGIFELKFFFNSALEMDDGTQVGSESVKAIIKKMVSEEDPKHPYSDEKIAAVLKEKLDVNIARRTVAKYRAVLGIESSSKRKQVF
ncbi:RNA polymerase factor sigma-54 [Desulfomicrobium escambiense]|uniref:RNA polymerase factor sigma-54 n=1 Tax=Desulfomicrobium escambiense TaxID=29503 RepID=UPI0004214839|nr:RNA polymerase factor sigma-54 [Desulfomicrobium escambiense]